MHIFCDSLSRLSKSTHFHAGVEKNIVRDTAEKRFRLAFLNRLLLSLVTQYTIFEGRLLLRYALARHVNDSR